MPTRCWLAPQDDRVSFLLCLSTNFLHSFEMNKPVTRLFFAYLWSLPVTGRPHRTCVSAGLQAEFLKEQPGGTEYDIQFRDSCSMRISGSGPLFFLLSCFISSVQKMMIGYNPLP